MRSLLGEVHYASLDDFSIGPELGHAHAVFCATIARWNLQIGFIRDRNRRAAAARDIWQVATRSRRFYADASNQSDDRGDPQVWDFGRREGGLMGFAHFLRGAVSIGRRQNHHVCRHFLERKLERNPSYSPLAPGRQSLIHLD